MIAARVSPPSCSNSTVTMTIWLLAVGREEVCPARAHVAGHVLHDERDAVRIGIDQLEELPIVDLRDSLVRLRLQLAQLEHGIIQVVTFYQCAFSIWTRYASTINRFLSPDCLMTLSMRSILTTSSSCSSMNH